MEPRSTFRFMGIHRAALWICGCLGLLVLAWTLGWIYFGPFPNFDPVDLGGTLGATLPFSIEEHERIREDFFIERAEKFEVLRQRLRSAVGKTGTVILTAASDSVVKALWLDEASIKRDGSTECITLKTHESNDDDYRVYINTSGKLPDTQFSWKRLKDNWYVEAKPYSP